MRLRNELARQPHIETSVTFLWYGGVAGGGLRSVGWKYPAPSTSACSILPIARRLRAGVWTFPRPALCYEDPSSMRTRRTVTLDPGQVEIVGLRFEIKAGFLHDVDGLRLRRGKAGL